MWQPARIMVFLAMTTVFGIGVTATVFAFVQNSPCSSYALRILLVVQGIIIMCYPFFHWFSIWNSGDCRPCDSLGAIVHGLAQPFSAPKPKLLINIYVRFSLWLTIWGIIAVVTPTSDSPNTCPFSIVTVALFALPVALSLLYLLGYTVHYLLSTYANPSYGRLVHQVRVACCSWYHQRPPARLGRGGDDGDEREMELGPLPARNGSSDFESVQPPPYVHGATVLEIDLDRLPPYSVPERANAATTGVPAHVRANLATRRSASVSMHAPSTAAADAQVDEQDGDSESYVHTPGPLGGPPAYAELRPSLFQGPLPMGPAASDLALAQAPATGPGAAPAPPAHPVSVPDRSSLERLLDYLQTRAEPLDTTPVVLEAPSRDSSAGSAELELRQRENSIVSGVSNTLSSISLPDNSERSFRGRRPSTVVEETASAGTSPPHSGARSQGVPSSASTTHDSKPAHTGPAAPAPLFVTPTPDGVVFESTV